MFNIKIKPQLFIAIMLWMLTYSLSLAATPNYHIKYNFERKELYLNYTKNTISCHPYLAVDCQSKSKNDLRFPGIINVFTGPKRTYKPDYIDVTYTVYVDSLSAANFITLDYNPRPAGHNRETYKVTPVNKITQTLRYVPAHTYHPELPYDESYSLIEYETTGVPNIASFQTSIINNGLHQSLMGNLTIESTPNGNRYFLSGNIEFDDYIDGMIQTDFTTKGDVQFNVRWEMRTPDGLATIWDGKVSGEINQATAQITSIVGGLTATFSDNGLVQTKTVELSGVTENNGLPLADIYIYNSMTGKNCDPISHPDSQCRYAQNFSLVTATCNDPRVYIRIRDICPSGTEPYCKNGRFATLIGLWDAINADTLCSISVIIPYQ